MCSRLSRSSSWPRGSEAWPATGQGRGVQTGLGVVGFDQQRPGIAKGLRQKRRSRAPNRRRRLDAGRAGSPGFPNCKVSTRRQSERAQNRRAERVLRKVPRNSRQSRVAISATGCFFRLTTTSWRLPGSMAYPRMPPWTSASTASSAHFTWSARPEPSPPRTSTPQVSRIEQQRRCIWNDGIRKHLYRLRSTGKGGETRGGRSRQLPATTPYSTPEKKAQCPG